VASCSGIPTRGSGHRGDELRLLFDDHALYVGARCADGEPAAIVRQLSRRDALAEADTFTLYLDPHRDRRTGVVLQVSAAAVQRDAAIYDDNFEDDTGTPSGSRQ